MPVGRRRGEAGGEQTAEVPPRGSGSGTAGERLFGWAFPPWGGRNFAIVVMARVAMSGGRALAGVVTPVYLALEGFSAVTLSQYVVVVALASAVLSGVIGLSADRIGRRPFLVVLPLITAAAGVSFAFFRAIPLLFVMGALGSFGRGAGAGAGTIGPYQPAELAFVTDNLAARHRNDAFGRLAFGSSLGATVGGLLALLVPTVHVHGPAATAAYRGAFLSIAGLSLVAGLLAMGLEERRPERPPTSPDVRRSPWQALRRTRLPRRSRWLLYRLWVTNTVNGAAVGMFGPFVTYWFFRRFSATPSEIGVLFAVINAATMASTLSAATVARRLGLVRAVTVVRSLQAVLLIPMVMAPSFLAAGGVYLLRMLVQRVGLPLRQSYVLAMADPSERAAVAALSNLPSQVIQGVSPLLSGYLIAEVSLAVPFEVSAALQLVNAGSFWAFFHRRPPEEEAGEHSAAPTVQATVTTGTGREPPSG